MTHVWYVSYGSNLARDRLDCYLAGGCPPGGARSNPGARDTSPPLADAAVWLPGTVYFAGDSPQWGGGVAFYDHLTPGSTAARAYLVSAGQFADIAAQEMYRLPAENDPVEALVLAPLAGGRHRLGPGEYETLVEVGRRDGAPMLTFTAPHGATGVPHVRPSPAYCDTIVRGLVEAHGWSPAHARDYVDRRAPQRRPPKIS
ncbi:histone deacetylase [Nocardioides acrostichi]|uniref:Histone deacetylase n=1 Tax=Nocardioides acrostichi TaxID=2784339 RepID=A0A930V2X6_9ACTN|nr:histone deacetylase [Nocardioides acrostichi]MBF4163019.1 histone deacetylase [Nocardioides acrostichi]